MFLLPYHTRKTTPTQPTEQFLNLWDSEVVPRLPTNVHRMAASLGAYQRSRKLARATDLLRGLLAYVLLGMSFRTLGAWAVLTGLADMSEAAWRAALPRCNAWLQWLLTELLSPTPSVSPPTIHAPQYYRILLVDATMLKHPGGTGDDWRLHTAFDLLRTRLSQVTITDKTVGESLDHFTCHAGDIIVADGGYGYRRNIAEIQDRHADAVVRIYPTTFPVEDAEQQAVDLFAWLRSRRGGDKREQTVWYAHGGKRYRVRVVAMRVPPAYARAASARARRKAQKKGRPVTADALLLAGWVLLVTTLDASAWSTEDVLRLYRARWQIEVLFKRMKQVIRLNQIRSTQRESVEATVRAVLIAWALQEQETAWVHQMVTNLLVTYPTMMSRQTIGSSKETQHRMSRWTMTVLSLETLRNQVRGTWSQARMRECIPRLLRLMTSKRVRSQQETEVRTWWNHRLEVHTSFQKAA